jgi:hypothetical protein
MIDIPVFKGAIPMLSPRLLPDGAAAKAVNCDLDSGALVPVKGVTTIEDKPETTASIHKMGDEFLTWDSIVDVVRALVADSGNRVMFTGDGYPKETNETLALTSAPYPTATRRLGIPAPSNALTITLVGSAESDVNYSASWVYTIVGKWADGSEVESAPSPPTAVTDIYDGITPRLTGFTDSAVAGVYTTHFRIYRLNSGNFGAEYQYVNEMAVTTTTFDDTVASGDLAEVIPSTNWTHPDAGLSGLTATSHGLVFGFKGNTIYPSEVFIPYAYPSIYSLVTESDIVGIGYTGSLVAVLTETVPYLLYGQDPATLSLRRLGYQQPCVSARSIVNIPGAIVYASNDGLFRIDEAGTGVLITDKLLTRAQWQSKTPANLIGFYYDQSYYGFFSGTTGGFRLNLTTGNYQELSFDNNVYAGHYSPEDDKLYILCEATGARRILSIGTGTAIDYTWESKEFSFPSQKVYTGGLVQGDFTAGNTTLTLYVDGVQALSTTITADGFFRIPPKRGKVFQIKLVGKATVNRVIIARSIHAVVGGLNG